MSLFIISIATIIFAGSNLFGIELSDILVRIIGISEIVALPILVFTTIKRQIK